MTLIFFSYLFKDPNPKHLVPKPRVFSLYFWGLSNLTHSREQISVCGQGDKIIHTHITDEMVSKKIAKLRIIDQKIRSYLC